MKVALVFPRLRYPSGDPPLGVAYLASAVKDKPGVRVDILDTTFHTRPLRYLERAFKENRYDLVGISIMSSMVMAGRKVAALAKETKKTTIVIMGGPHPTVMPEQTLADPNVDAVCMGEGDATFSEIVDNDLDLAGVRGVVYKTRGEIIGNEPRQPIEDINTIPAPAWELLPMRTYLRNWFQMDSVARAVLGTSMLASRGCPFNCTYCQPTLRKLFGRSLRKRSPENVTEEIAALVRDYGLKGFMFQDDTFICDPDWAVSVARAVNEKFPELVWGCNVRADLVEESMLRELHHYGLRKVNIGVESASQRILDEIYHKRISVDQVKRAVDTAKRLRLNVQGYFMLGAPTETLEEVRGTIKLACELPLDDATFSVTTPLPGTVLYDMTKELIHPGTEEFDYYGTPVYETDQVLPPATLRQLKREAYLRFYLSPARRHSVSRHLILAGNPRKALSKIKRFL
jgi:radical SAM superfamily enzyme YgiQ (UPF0313 family)